MYGGGGHMTIGNLSVPGRLFNWEPACHLWRSPKDGNIWASVLNKGEYHGQHMLYGPSGSSQRVVNGATNFRSYFDAYRHFQGWRLFPLQGQ